MNWLKSFKGRALLGEPLKKHTSFKIGGRAKLFVRPLDTADLKLLINRSKRYNIPILMMGAGSNILVGDGKVNAMVIKLDSPFFKKLSSQGGFVEAGAGVVLSQLVRYASGKNLSGAEFLSGIPGTVGGALTMNAGQRGKGICDLVEEVSVMDYNAKIKTISKKGLKYGYRKSGLGKYIILSAKLRLSKSSKREIRDILDDLRSYRGNTQNVRLASAGCVFKNPAGIPAGKLIDFCGLKGRRLGNACISEKHANFILNRGNATCRDVLKLMSLMKKEVRHKFNISLIPEIKIWK